jgi:hypothetical protein
MTEQAVKPQATEQDGTENDGEFVMKAGDLARVTKMLIGKGGGGNPPFLAMGFKVNPDNTVKVEHVDGAMRALGIHSVFKVMAGAPGTIATNDTLRFLDYVDTGLFAADSVVSVKGMGGKIIISDADRSVKMSAMPFNAVPRSGMADLYGLAPEASFVSSKPDRRAGPKAWEDWAAKGYLVFKMSMDELSRILAAGTLAYRRYRNALYKFTSDGSALTLSIQEARDLTADDIQYGKVEGTLIQPAVSVQFSFRHDVVEALWSSAKASTSKEAIIVYHPDEVRINVLYGENSEEGQPTLRLTQTLVTFDKPKAKA